ncbi:MAG: carboxypeptidase regulatory-like domain-containing protein [Granulicella sp.]
MKRYTLILALLVTFWFLPVAGRSQSSNGTIAGTVLDASGASVARATVTFVGVHTGVKRSTTTNDVGGFHLESVLLDTYTVTAEAPGFSKRSITNVLVNASVITSVNPVLLPGSVEQTVQVEAASELIQTDSGELSATLGTHAVANLPIFGLSPYALAITLPGASEPPADYQSAGFPNGFAFSINGSRPRANNFLIEGQDNNDQGLHGQGLQPSNLEAYKDVVFLLNSYSAEFGHGGGSVSNLILKSGTNTFHGSVWDRLSNSSLDAIDKADFLNGTTTKSKYRENVAGFSVGGPILKDKAFFFVSYQFDHYRSTANLNPIIVPTAAGVATLQALPTNPRIAAYLQAIGAVRGQSGQTYTSSLALGADPVTGTDRGSVEVGPYRRNLNNASNGSELDIKGDYVISPRDTFQLHYLRAPSINPYDLSSIGLPGFDTEAVGVAHNAGIAETHTFSPTLLNEFRFSYGRIGFTFDFRPETYANPLGTTPTISIGVTSGIIPGTTGEVTGFGAPSGDPQGRFHNTYQIQDSLIWNKGKHNIKAGFDLPIIQVRDQVPFNIYGSLTYGSAPQYSGLANYIDDFGGTNGSVAQNFGNPIARPVFYYQNYFVQDNWTFSKDLTLELGLRYEYSGTPFNHIKYLGVTPNSVSNYLSAVPQQPDRTNWAPRFGFAYTPGFLAARKTVLRGGFGIFYDGLFTNIDDNIVANAPNAASPQIISTTTKGNPRGLAGVSQRFPTLSRTAGPTDFASYITPNLRSPRILQWNLNVERELPGSFTAQVGYVGTRGEHLYGTTEFNPFLNLYESSDRLFNSRGRIVRIDNTGDSIYHGLQAQVVRKFRRGLTFRGAYTFSRLQDDTSEIFTAGQYSGFPTAQYPSSRKKTDYGLSAFDHRQRLVFSYVYELPKWSNAPRGVGEVVNGWQISGVSQFQSGSPANVEIGFDWNGDGIGNDRPEIGNPNAKLASFAVRGDDADFWSPMDPPTGRGGYCDGPTAISDGTCKQVEKSTVHFVMPYFGTRGTPVGRNSEILRGFEQWDFSAQKSFRTWREQSLDFRAEMFDVFNHGNTGTPNFDLFNGFADPADSSTSTSFGNYAPTVTGHRSIKMFLRYAF